MLQFVVPFLVIAFTLSGCSMRSSDGYVITDTTINASAKTCTFAVSFPAETYYGPEQGDQVYTVEPYAGLELNPQFGGYAFTLEGQTSGVGPALRRRCGGYLLNPTGLKDEAGS